MDMGGASLQIAYEVPGVIKFNSPVEVEVLKFKAHEYDKMVDENVIVNRTNG